MFNSQSLLTSLSLLVFACCFSSRFALPADLPPSPDNHAAPSELMTFTASPNGKWIAAFAADGTLLLWDTSSGRKRKLLSNHLISLGDDGLAFSPDSSLLAVGDARGHIQIFKVVSGTVVRKMQDRDCVDQFAFNGDGTRMATRNLKGITIWDMRTGRELSFFPEESRLSALALDRSGSLLATGSEDHTIRIRKIPAGIQRTKIRLDLHDWVNSIAFDEDRRLVLGALGSGSIGIWDISTGEKLGVLTGHLAQVDWIKVDAKKHLLFSVSDDKTLIVWDYARGIILSNMEKVAPGFVTTNGLRLVSEADNRIQVYEIPSGRVLKTFTYISPRRK